MSKRCPDPADVLAVALGRPEGMQSESIARHVAACDTCRQLVRRTRRVAAALLSLDAVAASTDCLSDPDIAAIADHSAASSHTSLAHLAECTRCRTRLASVLSLLEESTIKREIDLLDPQQHPASTRRGLRMPIVAAGGLLAAAVAAIVVLGPGTATPGGNPVIPSSPAHREAAITTTAAPAILSPEVVEVSDSLRWSAVPDGDLYRVRVWALDGRVAWTVDTKETAVRLPAVLQPDSSYVWEVRARTGWDRWVSSEVADLTLRASGRR